MFYKIKKIPVLFCCLLQICAALFVNGQVSYSAAARYSLRKPMPSYSGSAIAVRRTCDNAVRDIGFLSCGDLDTVTLKTFVVAANPLSSISTSAAAAFSLRRLSCSYAGSAILVRRSSDNTTQNIGFTAWGDLDTAAMKVFVGVNSAFVVTWYDQSGNGRNATQATLANQPRIMNAGVIERQNNMPAICWLGLNYSLSTAAFSAYGSAACYNGVAKVNSNNTYNAIVNKCNSNWPAPLDFYSATIVVGNGGGGPSFYACSQTFNAAQSYGIWTYQAASAGAVNAYFNSSSIASGATGVFADSGTPLFIGSRTDGVTGLNGWISEVITWAALPSATDRNFVEWTQSAYYGISGPLLTPIPVGAPSGYISTWYDQSGNGFHATQTSTANQPRIINVGVIEKSGTKTAIKFNGFPQTLTVTTPVGSYPVSISCLANTSGLTTNGAFVKLGGVTVGSSGVGLGVGATGADYDNTGFSVIGLKEWTVWCPSSPGVNYPSTPFVATETQETALAGSAMLIYLNGTNIPLNLATNVTSGSTITGLLSIGGYTNGTVRYPVVKETEVTIFGSALNTTRRRLLETNQASHYNIAIANSKYTPPTSTTYNLYVNGVGRESSVDSVNGTRASKGLGFLVGTAGTDFLKDNGDYITAGINCPHTPGTSTLNLPGTVVTRWINDWYVNKTDVNSNNGNLSFYFNFTDYGIGVMPGLAANYRLLYRTSPAANFTIVPGTTNSVSGARVQFLVDASNITTNYYYTIGTTDNNASPLPVELLNFTAEKAGQEVKTEWNTATEANCDYFIVQRSANALDFTDLGSVKAKGNKNSGSNYDFMDPKPLAGISYYRLKQVDTDKTFMYSKIVEIDFNHESVPVVFPNPSNGTIKISNCKGYEKIVVMDALGRVVYNTDVKEDAMNLSVNFLPDGPYFLTVHNLNGKKSTTKIILEKNR